MRAHSGRPSTMVPHIDTHPRPQRGFSLVELMVTIVLAGIIFAAMVPFFANALSRTAADNLRVTSNNIAQDRIEQIRLLDYSDITQVNLNTPPSPVSDFGDGRFGPLYHVAGQTRPYNIVYTVVPQTDAKRVTVSVTGPGSDFATVMRTIVKDSAAGTLTTVSGGVEAQPLVIHGLTITVSFKNWQDVTGSSAYGVTVTRVDTSVTPNVTFTPVPIRKQPSASETTLTWTDSPAGNLTGGMNYTYKITCVGKNTTSGISTPPFHLLKNARIKFDTAPGT
jgi:prepilin-type N-terminal cleavage/methylation domain-containing protein